MSPTFFWIFFGQSREPQTDSVFILFFEKNNIFLKSGFRISFASFF